MVDVIRVADMEDLVELMDRVKAVDPETPIQETEHMVQLLAVEFPEVENRNALRRKNTIVQTI